MKPFRVETGPVAALLRADVDTDQIIPKQFLKRIERAGFGECLFYDWRSDPDFLLTPGATVLVTGRNFGCGSSREHAVWALADAGFRTIIAPSFADIFASNCTNNGVLTICLDEPVVCELAKRDRLTIDLERCEVRDDAGFRATLEIDPFRRRRLLEGLDDIALTLQHEEEIAAYEARGNQ
jgi:3-isopropylmalate/(R)-2-methylmalate dehydratase small subunit